VPAQALLSGTHGPLKVGPSNQMLQRQKQLLGAVQLQHVIPRDPRPPFAFGGFHQLGLVAVVQGFVPFAEKMNRDEMALEDVVGGANLDARGGVHNHARFFGQFATTGLFQCFTRVHFAAGVVPSVVPHGNARLVFANPQDKFSRQRVEEQAGDTDANLLANLGGAGRMAGYESADGGTEDDEGSGIHIFSIDRELFFEKLASACPAVVRSFCIWYRYLLRA